MALYFQPGYIPISNSIAISASFALSTVTMPETASRSDYAIVSPVGPTGPVYATSWAVYNASDPNLGLM